jgi:uncharacterized protein YacL
MALLILRSIFILVFSAIGILIINWYGTASPAHHPLSAFGILFGSIALALGVIATDAAFPKKRLDVISSIYFGLIVGLVMTFVAHLVLTPLFPNPSVGGEQARIGLTTILAAVLCYTCISLLLQTRNDFRFIIPYVEFAKEVKGRRPLVLDTNIVIDGRIADLVETQILDNELVMPRFAITELQRIADSSDRMRRSRGRRGLDVLNRLQNMKGIDVTLDDRDLPEFDGQSVDLKLVALTKHLEGKLVTNDYNLNKVAKLHGVPVINLNDVANALKPAFLPGEELRIEVVKPGEEAGQGIGYLEDGTMVVIEFGRDHLHQTIQAVVTSVLQTSAGRMVFARFEKSLSDDAPGRGPEERKH